MAITIKNGAKVLYQWERGVALTVTSPCDVLRVSREEEQRSVDLYPTWSGDTGTVLIPDRMLTESGYLRAARIDKGDGEERVIERVRIIIRAAQKPAGGASSKREIRDWQELRIRMEALERAAREGKFNGDDGVTPHIGENGNWYLGETDTGVNAKGDDGVTPHIGENGNWFIGETDTGVRAKNEDVSEYANDLYTSGVLMTDDKESFVMTGGTSDTGMPQVVTGPGVVYIKGVRRELKKGTRRYNVPEIERTSIQLLRLDETTGEIGYAIWRDVTINGDINNGGEIVDIDTGDLLPRRSGGYYDVLLCLVTIPAGATEITQDMIRDLRGDDRYCGYVSSKIVGGSGGILEEKDPTVPAWAKQPQKPAYTAQEIGAQPAGDYAMRDELPENTSDLNNDSGFITRLASDLANYYTKSQTFTRDEINQKISTIPKFAISVVSSLPTTNISETTVYLVKSGTGGDLYTEYIHVNGVWEILGSQRVDLTGYATETWVNTKLGDYLKASDIAEWAKQPSKPTYNKSEVGLGNVANERQYSANNPPPYPVASVNGKTGAVETPKAFYVNVTNNGSDKPTVDKTADEIKAAYDDKYTLFAKLNTLIMPLRSVTVNQTPIGDEWEVIFEAEEKLTQGFVHSFKSTRMRLYGMSTFSVDYSVTDRKMITQQGAMNMFSQVGHMHHASEIMDLPAASDTPNSVKQYGAKGDGTTDDTAAFKEALAAERVVYVPGGTYKLSDTLFVGENCCLELSQDTVLEFTQTDKNCITLLRLAHLKGNHATIFVPYEYTANVINCDGKDDTDQLDSGDYTTSNATAVPPWTKWDPQWRMSRYVTDINICKRDYRGNLYSVDGTCSGTAVYLHLDEDDFIHYMWGVDMSGMRIAGAFTYGIRVINVGDATKTVWNHDMRIEAFMDACKIGLSVDNCNFCRFAVVIQPRRALATDDTTYTPYAERGIELVNCRQIDLMGSRVWDWNATNTLWSSGNDKQHLVLIGDCTGLILDDFIYYEESGDIRDRIYTDTPSNFEKMTILQEPITRWFKVVDGVPYYVDKNTPAKLAKQTDVDLLSANFITELVPTFTNQLAIAVGSDGKTVYNDIGYKNGTAINVNHPASDFDYAYTATTGFIPCKIGAKIRTENFAFTNYSVGNTRIVFYDANLQSIEIGGGYALSVAAADLVGNTGGGNNYTKNYVKTDNGFEVTIGDTAYTKNVAYVRFVVNQNDIGENPVITVDEEIVYVPEGFLADGIKIKAENVVGGGGTGGGSGGTSIDVTAEVGQTIVVKEIDANGKPTKWEAADYQPRTHYEGFMELYNATLAGLSESEVPIEGFSMQAGETYLVTWNGVEYTCVCVEVPDTGGMCYIGNGSALDFEDTGEPFCIALATADGINFLTVATSLDGVDEATVVIKGKGYIPIPAQYLTNAFPYYVDVVDVAVQGTRQSITCNETVDNVMKAINSGRNVILRIDYINYNDVEMTEVGGTFLSYIALVRRTKDYSALVFNANGTNIGLFAQEDGTFTVEEV